MKQTVLYLLFAMLLVSCSNQPQTLSEVKSEHNGGLDADNRQKMQRLYLHLDYTELTTCGHFIHMEQPKMFNDKLKTFMRSR